MKKVCGLEKISREKGGDYPRGQSIKDKGVAAEKKKTTALVGQGLQKYNSN